MGENGIGCRGSGARGGCRVLRRAGCDLAKAVGGEPEAGQDQGWAANMKDGSLEHLDIYVSDLARSGEFWGAFLTDLGYREFAKSPTGWSWTNDESTVRSEEHTSELQSHSDLVCRLLLEKKKYKKKK